MSYEDTKKKFMKYCETVCTHSTLTKVCKDIIWLKAFEYRQIALNLKMEERKKKQGIITDLSEEMDQIEKESRQIQKTYSSHELDKIKECQEILELIYEEGFHDVLGELFSSLRALNRDYSQIFTPYHVSHLMASLSMDPAIEKEDYKIYDPYCGSGSLLIAQAEVLSSRGIELDKICLIGNDIDRFCVAMTYVQFCEYGLCGMVSCEDALQNDPQEFWETPALIARC